MNEGTQLGMKVALARLGFRMVPNMINHAEKGPGMLHMDGGGIRFEPFNSDTTPLVLTWEEFDNGSTDGDSDV